MVLRKGFIMGLGDYTKCDLSAGQATIDTDILTKQMEIYYYSLMDKMRKKVTDVQYGNMNPNDRKSAVAGMSSTGSKDIINIANNIAEVTELLHTLQNLTDRTLTMTKATK